MTNKTTLIETLLEQIRSHPLENLDDHAARIEPTPTEDDVDDAAGYLLLEGFALCAPAPADAENPMLLFLSVDREFTAAEFDE